MIACMSKQLRQGERLCGSTRLRGILPTRGSRGIRSQEICCDEIESGSDLRKMEVILRK